MDMFSALVLSRQCGRLQRKRRTPGRSPPEVLVS